MKDRNRIILITLIAATLLSACSSVTLRPNGGTKDITHPDYMDRKDYYFFGLMGEHTVNVSDVCGDREVEQIQAVTTLSDWLHGLITLFVYTPRTAKVWCGEEEL